MRTDTLTSHPLTYHELRFISQLNQFSPGPQGKVFTIASTGMLKVHRVLPMISFVELNGIRNILAVKEPVNDLLNRGDINMAYPGKVMIKSMLSTATIEPEWNVLVAPLPKIISPPTLIELGQISRFIRDIV